MHTTSNDTGAAESDGRIHYRIDAVTGLRVAVLPASCRHGHNLAASGYRASEQAGRVHVTCAACVADGRGDSRWLLDASAEATAAAEFDDAPYADLARDAHVPPRPDAAAGTGGAARVGG